MADFHIVTWDDLVRASGVRVRLESLASNKMFDCMPSTRGQIKAMAVALNFPLMMITPNGGVMMQGARYFESLTAFMAARPEIEQRAKGSALPAPTLLEAATAALAVLDGLAQVWGDSGMAEKEREALRAALTAQLTQEGDDDVV